MATNIKYWSLFICLFATLGNLKAHQPDISSTMLIEPENKTWSLVVRASLSAFEQEIKYHYPDQAYETPKEFEQLIIKHLQANLGLFANQNDTIKLQNAFVKLGHETNVVFEVVGLPPTINPLAIQNTSFKEIHHNQSALLVLKKDFEQAQFMLNNTNEHRADLVVEDAKFALLEAPQQTSWSFLLKGLVGLLIIGFSLVVFKHFQVQRNQRMRSPQEEMPSYGQTIIRDLH
ncbi:MAG: DUF6702 family protein [Bacteroidia bacterium]